MAVLDEGILMHVPVLTWFLSLTADHLLVPFLPFFLNNLVNSLLTPVHMDIKS